jgi:hypothetical protein
VDRVILGRHGPVQEWHEVVKNARRIGVAEDDGRTVDPQEVGGKRPPGTTTVLSSAAGLSKIRAQAERGSGIGLKLFGFIAESVFTFIPESCSRSSGTAFGIIPESRSRSPGFPTVWHILQEEWRLLPVTPGRYSARMKL